jgi:chorismate dehydratase
VAASSYLNTAPLIWRFVRASGNPEVELIDATPAGCAEALLARQADVALVPVIEYQRQTDLRVVDDVCVGSKRRVRSVVLVSRLKDLSNVRRVALDESSRTSATLVKILFREFMDTEPEWTTSRPDVNTMLKESDAALIIGDPAMTLRREGLEIFDLAALWRRYTGLGFVFAMWMAREESVVEAAKIDFRAARDEGLARLEEIIDFYQSSLGLPRSELEIYLRENISFYLDNEMRAGLNLYFQLAQKHALIPVVKPLKSLQA